MSVDLRTILTVLAVVASSAVGTFVIAVVLDDLAGVLLAVKTGTFDPNKLPSFLRSQFGTVEALALFGLVVSAVVTAVGAALVSGGLTADALRGIADAALAAATAGAGAMLLSVLSDLFGKVSQLIARPLPPIAPVAASPPAPPAPGA